MYFQLLSAFGSVAEHCLPSILKTLIAWYEKQGVEWIISEYKPSKSDSKGRSELSHVSEQEFVSGTVYPNSFFLFLPPPTDGSSLKQCGAVLRIRIIIGAGSRI